MNYLSEQEKKAVALFKARLTETLGSHLLSLTLYGSWAWGEGHEESDVDVLVVIEKRTHDIWTQIVDVAYDIRLETEIDISPLIMSQEQLDTLIASERLLGQEIQRDGIAL